MTKQLNEHEEFFKELSLHCAQMLVEYEANIGQCITASILLEMPQGRVMAISVEEERPIEEA